MEERRVKCNWAIHCQISGCPHFLPHFPMHSNDMPNGNNVCEQPGTFCCSTNRAVNCVEVKLGAEGKC